jgi:hypothetical protein
MTGQDAVGSEPSSDKVQKFIGMTTTVFDTVSRKILPTDDGEEWGTEHNASADLGP